jgi:hypothetical protein
VPGGEFTRPERRVLGDKSLVPEANVVAPPPNQFTHELARDEPYFYATKGESSAPDGELVEGTKVVVLLRRNRRCRVVTATGLYVEVGCTSLRPLGDRT